MNVALVLPVAAALLLLSGRTTVALGAYAVLAAAAAAVIAPAAAASPLALALFVASAAMTVVAAPAGILAFVRTNRPARSLRPSPALPLRLALALGCAALGAGVGTFPGLAQETALAPGIDVVASGVAMLIVHRTIVAHLIALLVLGTGVTLCGAVLAPHVPESVELGAAFDGLIATFVGLALIRAFAAHEPLLDVEGLRRLRG